jgi:hypothetical protein
MDNVQINKIQKCNAPSSISFRYILLTVVFSAKKNESTTSVSMDYTINNFKMLADISAVESKHRKALQLLNYTHESSDCLLVTSFKLKQILNYATVNFL